MEIEARARGKELRVVQRRGRRPSYAAVVDGVGGERDKGRSKVIRMKLGWKVCDGCWEFPEIEIIFVEVWLGWVSEGVT